MNRKILGLLASGLIIAPMAANAQITTLTYEGDFMTGTSTYLPTGLAVPTNGSFPPTLPTSPTIGAFTATLVVDGSLQANDLNLVSYSFSFIGSNRAGTIAPYLPAGPAPFTYFGGAPDFCGGSGCIDLTTSKGGRITGATIGINAAIYNGSLDQIGIGPGGDSLSYVWGADGSCENHVNTTPGGGGIYMGGTINPCRVNVSNKEAGEWHVSTTQVPEIDPASAGGGLTLLLGGLAVLRGRRAKLTPSI